MPQRSADMKLPVVHVVMATYNGRKWIESQVKSIFRQESVDVKLVVSDDGSTDGTFQWLQGLAQKDSRVTLLSRRHGESGVGENFLYALTKTESEPGDYVALSDQDDLWRPDKLIRQISLIRQLSVDAVSSNVYAFTQTESGGIQKELIHKDFPQVEWDFVFEAPGAGSSFLLTYSAWKLVKNYVEQWGSEGIWLHDWYTYALVRAAGMEWFIDSEPLVAYRQHDQNELGAHKGLGAITFRLHNLLSGLYRDQFVKVHEAAMRVAEANGRDTQWMARMSYLGDLLKNKSFVSRMKLMRHFRKIRRKPLEGFALAVACITGVW